MSHHKLSVNLFANEDAFGPADFVPVFHRWIQEHVLPGHLPIDVADYAHVADGPGTLLVTSEANVHMERIGGRLTLAYVRKRPADGGVGGVLDAAMTAARLMAAEPSLDGRLTFVPGELTLTFNDRLATPNTDEAYAAVLPEVADAAAVAVGPTVEVRRVANDPLERLQVRVTAT